MRELTIFEKLTDRLGREPTDQECMIEVKKIRKEAWEERTTRKAIKGILPHQK